MFDDPIPTRDRFIEKWPRPQPLMSGDILAFRIVTPYSSVTSLVSEPDLKVTWIPNCSPSKATEVDILISPPTYGSNGWPEKSGIGTNLIGSYSLKNNQTIWAVYQVVDMPDLSQAIKGGLKFYKNRGEEDLKSDNIRAIVFENVPDGSRVIYDCVAVKKHD